MSPVLTIAGVTIREAVRRKLLLAFLAITAAMVALSAWGFDRLARTRSITGDEVHLALPQSFILFMFMFSFVLALSASTIGSPAVSWEIESGVLLTLVTRPVRRAQILLGKWLGLAVLLALYDAAVCALEVAVVKAVSGFLPPDPLLVAVYLFAEGCLLLTVALLLSTRMSVIAAGVVAVALFGASWLAGVVGALGQSFNIGALRAVGQVGRYVLPSDGLWHGAIYYLEPQTFIGQHFLEVHAGDPFFAQSAPSWAYLVWVGIWFLAVLGAGVASFERREL
ncbi:MAG TPA: ABC transporter permease [Acidimicrobiales bacterium]|nr:ABC transporter permease [Acidimicrobiales bacterium]